MTAASALSIPGLQHPTVAMPARALNTPWTPNATRPVLVIATVSIQGTTTLASGDEGRIELRSDAGAPVTVRSFARNRIVQTLGVTVGTQSGVGLPVWFLVPAGWQVTLATVVVVAAPAFTLHHVTEITL